MAGQPVGERTSAVWTLPNVISVGAAARRTPVPLAGARPRGRRLGPRWCSTVAGFTDWLDGYLARRLEPDPSSGEILDPVADRLYILAAVIGLLCATSSRGGSRCIPLRDLLLWGLVPFLRTRGYRRCRCTTSARPRRQPALRLPAAVPRRGRGAIATLAQVFGWAFAIWGIGLYWWAGMLYAWQVRKLLPTETAERPRPRDGTVPTT